MSNNGDIRFLTDLSWTPSYATDINENLSSLIDIMIAPSIRFMANIVVVSDEHGPATTLTGVTTSIQLLLPTGKSTRTLNICYWPSINSSADTKDPIFIMTLTDRHFNVKGRKLLSVDNKDAIKFCLFLSSAHVSDSRVLFNVKIYVLNTLNSYVTIPIPIDVTGPPLFDGNSALLLCPPVFSCASQGSLSLHYPLTTIHG